MSTDARLSLPGGGGLQGIPALAAQTAACSAASDLLAQVAPLLAAMQCQNKILLLLKPLIEVVKELPNPSPQTLQNFAKAAVGLEPCLATLAQANQVKLAHDLICLEIRSLTCFLANLNAAVSNAAAVSDVLSSYEPITGVLLLAGDVFHSAGLQVPAAPPLSGKTDAASLAADAKSVKAFVSTLQSIAATLGGC